jgi:hypothetical protein
VVVGEAGSFPYISTLITTMVNLPSADIRIILDEEEASAWKLSIFPHLLLPDLLEAHIETLGLKLACTITSGAAELDECLTAA